VPTLTDEAGDYLLGGLAPGEQALRVRSEGYASASRKALLGAGAAERLDVVLGERPRIRGRVVRPDGTPCSGVLVRGWAVDTGQPSGRAATTDDEGQFELSCPEGPGWKLHLRWAEDGVEIDSGIEPIRGARSGVVIVIDEARDATARLEGIVCEEGECLPASVWSPS
jgi:hypothetical protein